VLGQLAKLALAVEGEAPDSGLVGGGDVAGRLDRVRVDDVRGLDADRLQALELAQGGDLEARAELGERLEHLEGGVALERVEALDPGQTRAEPPVAVTDRVEIADEVRRLVVDPPEHLGPQRLGPVVRKLELVMPFVE